MQGILCSPASMGTADSGRTRPALALVCQAALRPVGRGQTRRQMRHLTERLQLALESGAKQVLVPSENKRDLADVPDEVLNKIQAIFYTDPANAAIRAMGLE
jgi:predicted ATP-dependent Lon-type protease